MNNAYIAYTLWFFVGYLGGHRIYLGKFISGFLMMGLFFLGGATTWLLGLGFIPLAIWGIWWIIDIFLIGKIIDKNLRKDILKNRLRAEDLETELKRLYELYESGAISKEEFETRKEILFR